MNIKQYLGGFLKPETIATLESLNNIDMGELHLPSGRIVACDPMVEPDTTPFVKTVPAGTYPTFLIEDSSYGIAAAMIKMNDNDITHWESALLPEQDSSTLKAGEYFGYPVDAGLGCFMDQKTSVLLTKLMNDYGLDANGKSYYDVFLLHEFFGPNAKGCWHNHFPDPQQKLNCVMFQSGYGDGVYPSYWGLDKDNAIVCLVTDFHVIIDEE